MERDENGKIASIIKEDITVVGYGDWVEGLPETRSLSRGAYQVEGQARATEDDIEYFNIQVTLSKRPTATKFKQPSLDNSHKPETASQD